MTALTDAPVPATDTTVTKNNSGVKYVVAALVASVAVLGVAALLSDGARVNDGRTNSLSTYVTGQTANVGPSVSDYAANNQAPPAPVVDDAEQHRRQLGR